ncbi:rod shape-determining protein MreC [Desulfovibrio mangrovi]|uniref:rod shape-determining protein MreC n=1 Tax=Desulfovibrio mangrovi TaxID=2976983 RepID=UPI0022481894|nr:rod shape-determining protein MreC [Desulfovibrio mangrovi]UZP69092.1 rod shape-determining protein MreC [Desulfovibrio mangrovi]
MVLVLCLYLTLFTWNLRTGYVDRLATHTGLEFVGAVLKPGKWIQVQVAEFWEHYIDLVGVRKRNDELEAQLKEVMFDLAEANEDKAEVIRLRSLLSVSAPAGWERIGARVIAHRLGVQAELESILLDKGYLKGAGVRTPVVTHEGVVGRVFRAGPYTSSVLLLTDQNSRIAVVSQENRTPGIIVGQGPRSQLEMRYVALNAPLGVGELLVTSGQAGAFPKGLPVARIVSIEYSDISLFQKVMAEPLANLDNLEEVLLIGNTGEVEAFDQQSLDSRQEDDGEKQ